MINDAILFGLLRSTRLPAGKRRIGHTKRYTDDLELCPGLPHIDRIDAHLKRSLMLVTALVPHLGYDRSAEIAKWALKNDSSLTEAALLLGYANQAQLDLWLQPVSMLGPLPSHAKPAPDT